MLSGHREALRSFNEAGAESPRRLIDLVAEDGTVVRQYLRFNEAGAESPPEISADLSRVDPGSATPSFNEAGAESPRRS